MVSDIINACAYPDDWLSSWQFLAVMGIFTSWLFVSLIYMLGSLLDNVGLMARAKAEVWEIITTSIIFASVLMLVSGACLFEPSAIGLSTSGNMFMVAQNYLLWLRMYTMSVFKIIMEMNNVISLALSAMGGFRIFGIGVSGQPFAGLQPLMHIINLFMNGTMICLIITVAQITVLKFIQAGAFNVLLPVGIICRAFPFTRRFGGALIAIAIGLFIFYPFMLVVDDAIMGNPSNSPNTIPQNLQIQGNFGNAISSNLASIGFGMLTGGMGFLYSIGQIIITYFLDKPIVAIGKVALAAFILPALNSVVFVAMVRDLSRVLGQEVDATSLSRLV